MNILVIDYLSPPGHANFDQIHIQSLLDLGHKLCLVGRRGQFPAFNASSVVNKVQIPEKYYKCHFKKSISERILGILCLLWIKRHIKLREYEKIVFLTYDILSIPFFRADVPVYLVNHNNVDQFESSIKLKITKHLPSNYAHVALNEYMADELRKFLSGKTVFMVPHGYLPPTGEEVRPSFVQDGECFIFCPVNRNFNDVLIKEILKSEMVDRYLKKRDIILYVKSQLLSQNKGNIKVLPYLNTDEYNYMLSHSKAVILPYGDDFRYRCSGILFECVPRKIPILATEREALLIYKNRIDIRFFRDSTSLIFALNDIRPDENKYYDIEQFQPAKYWGKILV